jgi:hypothetical protein
MATSVAVNASACGSELHWFTEWATCTADTQTYLGCSRNYLLQKPKVHQTRPLLDLTLNEFK